MERSNVLLAAERFRPEAAVREVQPFGNGNVNATFLVVLADGRRFILQRVNTSVFRNPDLVLGNMRTVTEHVRRRLEFAPLPGGRRWELPALLPTRDGRDHWEDEAGSFWRALHFVPGRTWDRVESAAVAGEVGWALGTFHALVSDLPVGALADTLRGFHVTPEYLSRYDRIRAAVVTDPSPEGEFCRRFVEERRGIVGALEEARARGLLRIQPVHGDPKVNNIVLDERFGRAVGMIDLDTVKPGLVHYDLGDCLRSGCNRLGEDAEPWQEVRFDPELCRALLAGYLYAAGPFLTESDCSFIYDAVRLIAFELGLRFLTDHLEGDVYFRTRRRRQNLARALVQFGLTQSIEAQEATIRRIIARARPAAAGASPT